MPAFDAYGTGGARNHDRRRKYGEHQPSYLDTYNNEYYFPDGINRIVPLE
jgi:hypothetical protein